MKAREAVKDVHATIRREIVDALGPSFAPHRSGNPLDGFLRDFDKNGLVLLELAFRAHANECLENAAKVAESRSGDNMPLYSDTSHEEIDLRATRSNTAKMIAAAIRTLKENV